MFSFVPTLDWTSLTYTLRLMYSPRISAWDIFEDGTEMLEKVFYVVIPISCQLTAFFGDQVVIDFKELEMFKSWKKHE